jgi:hypothetical protein
MFENRRDCQRVLALAGRRDPLPSAQVRPHLPCDLAQASQSGHHAFVVEREGAA